MLALPERFRVGAAVICYVSTCLTCRQSCVDTFDKTNERCLRNNK
eukprot:UN25854